MCARLRVRENDYVPEVERDCIPFLAVKCWLANDLGSLASRAACPSCIALATTLSAARIALPLVVRE
jgi:hypothetical protein